MVTDSYFVIGFDARHFSFLLNVYVSAKGVLFPLTVIFLHTNSEKPD